MTPENSESGCFDEDGDFYDEPPCLICGGEGYGDYMDFNEDPLWVGFDT